MGDNILGVASTTVI